VLNVAANFSINSAAAFFLFAMAGATRAGKASADPASVTFFKRFLLSITFP
jgi:hypothetical protein